MSAHHRDFGPGVQLRPNDNGVIRFGFVGGRSQSRLLTFYSAFAGQFETFAHVPKCRRSAIDFNVIVTSRRDRNPQPGKAALRLCSGYPESSSKSLRPRTRYFYAKWYPRIWMGDSWSQSAAKKALKPALNIQGALEHRDRVEACQRQHRSGLVTRLFLNIVGSTQLQRAPCDREGVALEQKHAKSYASCSGN